MEINIGARVTSSDGQEIGQADRLVVNPKTGQILEIVIRKGVILTRDIVVPFYAVQEATPEAIRLNLTAAEVAQLPDFEEELYALPPAVDTPTGPYTLPGLLYPQTYGITMMPVTVAKRMPPGSVVLTKGMEVLAKDGKIGVVDEVLAEPGHDTVAAFVVRQGMLLSKDIVVPMRLVKQLAPGQVLLAVTKGELQKLLSGPVTGQSGEESRPQPPEETKNP